MPYGDLGLYLRQKCREFGYGVRPDTPRPKKGASQAGSKPAHPTQEGALSPCS